MTNKQLAVLFGISLVNFLAALSALPFLPLYATNNLGADSGQAGIFLAIVSTALTVGTIGGGWLSQKLQRRKLLILLSSFIALPAFWFIGSASTLWQLTILTSLAWFAIGVSTTMVRIIGGILADESERGRVFGIIGAATPLSALIAGVVGGRIVDRWDIATLFMMMSLVFILQLVLVLFIDEISATEMDETRSESLDSPEIGKINMAFWLLVLSSFIGFVALSEMIMGRPLLMDELGFDGTAISGVLIAGGLVSLPLTFLVGWLSDRFGRKTLLLICYLVATVGMFILAFSEPLWHFWVSEMFLGFVGIASVVGSAMVTDIVPRGSLDSAMSRFSAAGWIGSIFGFAFVGYVIDWVGLSIMFATASLVMLFALALILPIQQPKAKIVPLI